MKRFAAAAVVLLLLPPLVACAQSKGGWLRGEWEATAYQTDSNDTWAMVLTVKGRRFSVEYPSLECAGRWRLVSLSRRRAVFRETITKGAERCAPRGRVVLERLNARQLGYLYSYEGSADYVASAILNRRQ